MAAAYLEKTNKELKEDGWGTTNVAIIANEGCDAIYAAIDSRTTSGNRMRFIKGEDKYKCKCIKSCNVFATWAGHVHNCRKMLAHVKRYFKERKEIVNGICEAPEVAHQFIQSWEKTWEQEINGCTIMSGWLGNVPYVYKIKRSGIEKKSKSNRCEGFVSGSGGPLVWKYLESCMHNLKVQSSEELFQNVKRAVLYATLFDPYSGGYVRVFDVKKTDTIKLYDELVLVALLDNYNALSSHLSNSLVFLFHKDDYAYTHEINVEVNEGLERQFHEEGYLENVVVKRGTFIVRLVHFKKPIDKLYENLKRKNSQRIVPSEVQDLQSVEIEEIGKAPILCGKLSEDLVRILQNL